MPDSELVECRLVRALADGTLVLTVGGRERRVELDGVELPRPPAAGYFGLLERAARGGLPLRCRIVGEREDGTLRGQVEVYGWHDKSGDVWLELAQTLIDEGLGRAAAD